jgi:hypothetical protein
VRSQKKYAKPILLHAADMSEAAVRKSTSEQWKRTFDIDATAEKKFSVIGMLSDGDGDGLERDEAEHADKGGEDEVPLAELLKAALAAKQQCAGPMLMSADGEPLPLSELGRCADKATAQSVLDEPTGTPPKLPPKRKRAAVGKENKKAEKPVQAKKPKAARKPAKAAEADEEEEAPPPPPPPAVVHPAATVRRTDSAGRTELRKAANADSDGNGVIVFDDDVVAVVLAGDDFSYVQAGRKKGYMQSAYLVYA